MSVLILTKENVAQYVQEHTSIFRRGAVLHVHEVGDGATQADGDGYVNFIFRIRDGEHCCVVKQAREYARSWGEEASRLTAARNRLEVDILRIRSAICPHYIPTVYYCDAPNNIFIMEDLSGMQIMRFELNSMKVFPDFPRQIGEYFAACNFFTSLEYLPDRVFRGLEAKFMNPEMREIMESFIFLEPDPELARGLEDPDPREYLIGPYFWNRVRLRQEMVRMRNIFMRRTECLIHGDLHTSNIFLDQENMKVIDMEYTFMGPEAHDMGYLTANCISEYAAFHFRREFSEEECGRFRVYLLTKLHDIYACYCKSYLNLFMRYAKPLYRNLPGYPDEKLDKFCYEMAGFAACSNFSRTTGMCGYPDFDVIRDPDLRVKAKMLSALISVNILEHHDKVRCIGDMIAIMRETARHFMDAVHNSER